MTSHVSGNWYTVISDSDHAYSGKLITLPGIISEIDDRSVSQKEPENSEFCNKHHGYIQIIL